MAYLFRSLGTPPIAKKVRDEQWRKTKGIRSPPPLQAYICKNPEAWGKTAKEGKPLSKFF